MLTPWRWDCKDWRRQNAPQRRGLIGSEVTLRQVQLLESFGLPTAPPACSAEDLLAAMRLDKKAVAGRLRLVLPRRLGEAALLEGIPEEEVRAALLLQPV
jgi:3-dehydroquinate synthase